MIQGVKTTHFMRRLLAFVLVLISISTSMGNAQTIGLMGSFNSWSSDIIMNTSDGINYTLSYNFSAAEQAKFRQDGSWTINWGNSAFPSGTGIQDGPNIPVPAGGYDISFNIQNGAYSFESNDTTGTPPFINPTKRQIVLQGFWWDYWNINYPNGWSNYLCELAPRLKELGIDAIWIPPTIKNSGTNSVGYAPFDHYDLGDKYQKGSLKTRMGDKDEIIRLVSVLKANGIDVIQDIVLNHVTNAGSSNGAGGSDPAAMDDGATNKHKNFRYACFQTPASSSSSTNYLSRMGRFSKNWQNFYPNPNNPCCTNDINSPFWGPDIAYESNSFGLSSNAIYNPNQSSGYMRDNMRDWLIWYKKQLGWDGLRIDAVKHFSNEITEDFLWNLQNNAVWASGTDEMFAVGEWVGGSAELDSWANAVQNRAGTFDFSLRGGLYGIVTGNGNYDLSQITGTQQSNRQRTVPFVNNHDTFRPQIDAQGNYTGWNSGSELAAHIEPNDSRSSIVHAITLALDGAPQIFFEDLFDIGYNGNRFNHFPENVIDLPVRSDIANLIWCHQHLHFKEGAYVVRWSTPDALVIERESKALICVTDQWSQWQNLTGVQTSWPDGTVLYDYSGANGTQTSTVYGGGKVDLSIPPCDGSAPQNRKGYSIWAPEGITDNYSRPVKNMVQEWELSDDLGDRHNYSLQQGGSLPDSSLDCRVVGRIFAKSGSDVEIDLYPESSTNSLNLYVLDNQCNVIDSIYGEGELIYSFIAGYDGWHTIRVSNTTSTQMGQRCWVKMTYNAPEVVETNVEKLKCECDVSGIGIEESYLASLEIYPNPVNDVLLINAPNDFKVIDSWSIYTMGGQLMRSQLIKITDTPIEINVSSFDSGVYFIELEVSGKMIRKLFVKH